MAGSTNKPPPPDRSDCRRVGFSVALSNPDPLVLRKVKVDSILRVALTNSNDSLEVQTIHGETVGFIVHREAAKLKRCIKLKHSYIAQVTNVDVDACIVLVSHGR